MNRIFSLLYLIIVGLFGWWVSQEINGFLKISFKAKKIETPIKIQEKKADSLSLRLVDFGGVGILPDTANWGNNWINDFIWGLSK